MPDLSSFNSATPLTASHAAIIGDAEARTRLAHALQTTLETDALIGLFFRHVQPLVPLAGLSYRPANSRKTTLTAGRRATHKCQYHLNLPDHYLGEIVFYRRERFSEDEHQTLETLLTSLVFPLLNAHKYHQALARALVDPLTGVGNRAAMDTAVSREHELLRRGRTTFALLMVDIDHFKHINDSYGHATGDRVLQAVASTISDICRASDMVFRYGGEEFAVLLSATGAAGGLITAERLRRAMEKLDIGTTEQPLNVRVSIGLSACTDAKESLTAVFDRADKALYQAKAAGRNRICCEPAPITLAAATGAVAG